MNWSAIRGTTYAAAAAAVVGTALSAIGWADFDLNTGVVDLKPFNLYTFLGVTAVAAGSPILALVALVKKWGTR